MWLKYNQKMGTILAYKKPAQLAVLFLHAKGGRVTILVQKVKSV